MGQPITIALTGGIGSGKTTVANLFKELNIPIIDTDIIARQIVEPGQTAYDAIIKKYGKTVLTEQGELDRKKLSDIIFQDSSKRKELENLLHPLIYKEINRLIETLDCLYCIVVIPLLVETGQVSEFDRVLVVDVEPETQVFRTIVRDNIDADKARIIMKNQASREQRLTIADDVINNNDTDRTDISSQVHQLHEKYMNLAQQLKQQ